VSSYLYMGLGTIFVAAFALFFIFHNIEQLALDCKAGKQDAPFCDKLNGFTIPTLVVLLIIGGFVMTLTGTAYVMLSTH